MKPPTDPIPDAPDAALDTDGGHRWRVFTDGTISGSHIYAPNGQEVLNITSLSLHMEVGEPVSLSFTVMAPSVAVLSDEYPTIVTECIHCGRADTHHCGSRPPFTSDPFL